MQLVLSKNRIIAHGENFLAMGGVVINTETGARYENATIAECEGGCPSDINEVGYEYHAGVFVPCAPYGKGNNNGYFMEVCETCATPRNSGLPIKDIKWSKVASVTCAVADTQSSVNKDFTLPVNEDILAEYSMLRYRIKAGSFFNFAYLKYETNSDAFYTNLINLGEENLFRMFCPRNAPAVNSYLPNHKITFEEDIVFSCYILQNGLYEFDTYNAHRYGLSITRAMSWYTANGTSVNPLTINIQMPSGSGTYAKEYYNHANIVIELEGRK